MANDFRLVSRQLQEEDEAIVLAEVDCSHDAGVEICAKHSIVAYPTLKLFRYGSFYKSYNAKRDAKTMKNWLLKKVQGSSKVLESVSELKAAREASTDETSVSVVVTSDQLKLLAHYLKTSKKVKQHPQFAGTRFYHVVLDPASSQASKAAPTVTLRRPDWLHTPLEDPEVSVPLTLKLNLTNWIFNQTYGSLGYRTPASDRNIYDPRTVGPLVVVFHGFDFQKEANTSHFWRNQLIPFTKDYPMLTFTISRSQDYEYYLKTKGLAIPSSQDLPVAMFYDQLTVPFAMEDAFSANAFRSFLETMIGPNKVLPRLRSKYVCPDNVNWTLTCIESTDFKKKVSLNPKDVLLVIHNQANDEAMKMVMKLAKVRAQLPSLNQTVDPLTLDVSVNEVPHAFESPDYPVIFYVTRATQAILRVDRKFTDILVAELTRRYVKKESTSANRYRVKSEL